MSALLRFLAWLGLPSWVAPLLIIGLITSALGGSYMKGRMDSSASCREKELLAQIAAMERDRKIADLATTNLAAYVKQLENEAAKMDQEVAKYEEELKSRADRCALTPDDVNRLRNIKGRGSAR